MGNTILRALSLVALVGMAMPSAARAGYIEVYSPPTFIPDQGGYLSAGVAVNDAGVAIGGAEKYLPPVRSVGGRALRWDASGTYELGVLGTDPNGYAGSSAAAFNAAGTIVGTARKYDASGVFKGNVAVRWDASGAVTELGNLGTDRNGNTNSGAFAINAAGTVFGNQTKYSSQGANLGQRVVRWDASGTAATELDAFGAHPNGQPENFVRFADATGRAFGMALRAYDAAGVYKGNRVVRWEVSGAATELGTLGGETEIWAANAAGTAVGQSGKVDAAGVYKGTRAVRWNAAGTAATELDNLGTATNGFTVSAAGGVNDAGTVVGQAARWNASRTDTRGQVAVRWDASGTDVTQLGNLGTDARGRWGSWASAINNAGIAVGSALAYDSTHRLLGQRAVYWGQDEVAVDLNTLIDPASGWTLLSATAISDTNWVIGQGEYDHDLLDDVSANPRAFLLQLPDPTGLPLLSLVPAALLRRRRTCACVR